MGTDIPQLSRNLMVGSAITVCAADYPEATRAAVKAWKNALGFDVFSLLGAPCSAATSDVYITQVATSTPTTADPNSGLMCGSKVADAKACADPVVVFDTQPVTYGSITTLMISVASHHHPIDVTPDVTTGPVSKTDVAHDLMHELGHALGLAGIECSALPAGQTAVMSGDDVNTSCLGGSAVPSSYDISNYDDAYRPGAVASLGASSVLAIILGPHNVTLTWNPDDVHVETGFVVEKWAPVLSLWLREMTLPENARTALVRNQPDGLQRYRVRATTNALPPSNPYGPAVELAVPLGQCANGTAVPNAANSENHGLFEDCEALLKSRDTLRGAGTLAWNASAVITTWPGVTVGSVSDTINGVPQQVQRVTSLRLPGSRLSGSLPASLGGLAKLRRLQLNDNTLTGSIPAELGSLSSLVTVYLHRNTLTEEIPGELGSLSNLKYLHLGGNRLTGEIPGELGSLSNLNTLYLYGNQLTGAIPAELGSFSLLQFLRLDNNDLTGDIPEALARPPLLSLKLAGNAFSGCIPDALRDIGSNDLDRTNSVDPLGKLSYCPKVVSIRAPEFNTGDPLVPDPGPTEGNALAFTLMRTGSTSAPLTVSVRVSERAPGDMIQAPRPTSAIFAAGYAVTRLTVHTTNDMTPEVDSTITVEIVDGATYDRDGTAYSAAVTVSDNDGLALPTITIARSSSTAAVVTEGTSLSFTLTRSGNTTAPLTANVTLSTDPAGASVYSGSASRTVTFSANRATATLPVSTVNDTTDEANADVTATVATGTGYTAGAPASATVTVNDNDDPALPTITIARSSSTAAVVTEGTPLSFTLTRSGNTTAPLTANVTLSTDPAGASVYSGSASRTVTFSANRATATLPVSTVNDTTDEANADVTATVATSTGYTAGAPASATVTVNDNDDPALPTITIARSSSTAAVVTEGTPLSFTLTRSGNTTAPLTANVTLSTDPAGASVYSGSASRTVTFSANRATATLPVSTVNDTTDEANADVTATVATGTGYTAGAPASATVTVNDNDDPALQTVTIALTNPATTQVTEGTSLSFTLTRSGSTTASLTANVTLSTDPADASVYSGSANRTVTFSTNRATATLTVSTVNDSTDEANADVTATVATGTGYTAGDPASAEITVRDNDGSGPRVRIRPLSSTATVTEGQTATFVLDSLDNGTSVFTILLKVEETGAMLAATVPTSVATLSPTIVVALLNVATVNDSVDEPNSTITVTVVDGPGYELGTPESATVAVEDNDGEALVTIAGTAESVIEGEPAQFTLTRTGSTVSSLSVSIAVSGYPSSVISETPPSSIAIAAGSATGTLSVATADNTTDENARLVLAEVLRGTGYVPGTPNIAVVTVNDNDGAGLPTVTIARSSSTAAVVTEGTSLRFTLTRSGNTTAPLTANVTLSTDPAGASVYSGSASRTVMFSANRATATLTVSTVNDTTDEANADVTATIATGTGYAAGTPGSAVVTVNDNDGPALPTITIARSSSTAAVVTEGASLRFTLTRSGSTTGSLTANVTLSTDPAGASVYSGSASRTVRFSASRTTATLTVSTVNDTTDEENADVTATVATGTGYVPGAPGSATVTVNDNDAAPITTATLTVRIAGRHRASGNAEVALQQQDANGAWGDRQLPQMRTLLASSTVDSWHHSGELTLTSTRGNESVVVRIAALRQSDGDVEVALQYRTATGWSDRQLPTSRYLKANVPVDSWRYSSSLTVTASSASTGGASGAAGQSGTDGDELRMAVAPPGTPADSAPGGDLPMDTTP